MMINTIIYLVFIVTRIETSIANKGQGLGSIGFRSQTVNPKP